MIALLPLLAAAVGLVLPWWSGPAPVALGDAAPPPPVALSAAEVLGLLPLAALVTVVVLAAFGTVFHRTLRHRPFLSRPLRRAAEPTSFTAEPGSEATAEPGSGSGSDSGSQATAESAARTTEPAVTAQSAGPVAAGARPPGSVLDRVAAVAPVTTAVAGAAAVGLAAGALLDRGVSPALGPWLTGIAGLAALVVAVPSRRHTRWRGQVLLGLGTVAALVAGVLVVAPGRAVTEGPFVRLAELAPVLGRAREDFLGVPYPARLGTDPDLGITIGLDDGLATLDHGRAGLVAVTDGGRVDGVLARVLGTAGGLVASVDGEGATEERPRTIALDALDGTGRRALVTGVVGEPSRVGPDGSVWLLAETGGTRRLDLTDPPAGTLTAADLPEVAERLADRGTVGALVPVPGGALSLGLHDDAIRLVRHTAAGPETLAGTVDSSCGLSTDPLRSVLSRGPMNASADEIWLVAGRTPDAVLLRIDATGRLSQVDAALPGDVTALVPYDGGVVLHTDTGLWALPADHPTVALPDPTCPPAGGPVAPELRGWRPLAEPGPNRVGSPLDRSGTWVSGREEGGAELLELVRPDGTRTVLGSRDARIRGVVVPDGGGGAWWLDRVPGDPAASRQPAEGEIQLVHGAPGREPARYPPVSVPGAERALVADLGGRPPLLGTENGLFRIDAGATVPLLSGRVSGGVTAPDGRTAVVRDGRVVARDGTPLLGGAGPRTPTTPPIAVQLAHGTAPAEVLLSRPRIAFSEEGDLLVADEDLLLALAPDGAARVVAQDPRLRLTNRYPVPGGLVVAVGQGTLVRIDP